MKKYTVTGKNVFRDNQQSVFYVMLNSDTMIQVENNPEDMACLAWNQASSIQRSDFIMKHFPHWNYESVLIAKQEYSELLQTVKDKLIEYQKSKMENKP